MAIFAVAGRTATTTPDSTKGPALAATTAIRPFVREVGIFNTTTTAFAVAIVRASTVNTTGASAMTEVCIDDDAHVAVAIATNIPTAAHTVGAPIRQATIGAAAGSGIVWTFPGSGFVLDNSANAGFSIIVPTGTGQHYDWYFTWEE